MSTWRSLIRVDRFNTRYVYFIVPGWDHKKSVKRLVSTLPEMIRIRVKSGLIYFHAHVNISADTADELTFDQWEAE